MFWGSMAWIGGMWANGPPRALARAEVSERSVRGFGERSPPKIFFGLFLSLCQNFELTYLLATDFIFFIFCHDTQYT